MSTLFYRALVTRINSYPKLATDVERKYAEALKTIDGFNVNPAGDFVDEIERFRFQLRIYDLAMMSCFNQSEHLLDDIQNDIASVVGDLSKIDRPTSDPGNSEAPSASDLGSILADCYTRLRVIRHACKEHRKIAERGRKNLSIAMEQKSLRRLKLLIAEMRAIDSENA